MISLKVIPIIKIRILALKSKGNLNVGHEDITASKYACDTIAVFPSCS